jgi:tetratricopeptide (TPR) repeat protein
LALKSDIAARLASRRGNRQEALAQARGALELWNIHTDNQPEFLPEPAMRFHFASLLRSAGKTDSASALFRSLVPPTTWMGFYTARAALELAEIEEANGDRDAAQRHFLTALRLWDRGDTSVASLRARARRGALKYGELERRGST